MILEEIKTSPVYFKDGVKFFSTIKIELDAIKEIRSNEKCDLINIVVWKKSLNNGTIWLLILWSP
jgi:hypothetical protein